jgi:repressor LexA
MKGLTDRQNDVLRFIRKYIKTEGLSPSVRDIGAALGIKSPNAVLRHLNKVEGAGYIRRRAGTPRGIVLCDQPSQN